MNWLGNRKPKVKESDTTFVRRELGPEDTILYAKQLQENPFFTTLMDVMEKEACEFWKQTSTTDIESREGLYLFLRTIGKIRGRIELAVNEAISEIAMANETERVNSQEGEAEGDE